MRFFFRRRYLFELPSKGQPETQQYNESKVVGQTKRHFSIDRLCVCMNIDDRRDAMSYNKIPRSLLESNRMQKEAKKSICGL